MSTKSDIDFICPETGSVHRIGQNAVDVGHGARPTGPQICLNCCKTLHELLAAQDRNSQITALEVAQAEFKRLNNGAIFPYLHNRLAELKHQADSEKEIA